LPAQNIILLMAARQRQFVSQDSSRHAGAPAPCDRPQPRHPALRR
jgi:hypothetical protein